MSRDSTDTAAPLASSDDRLAASGTAAAAPSRARASATTVDGASGDPSLRHLRARLAIVESRVRAAVKTRRGADLAADDRFLGLYVSDAEVDELLARGTGSAGSGTPSPTLADADRAAFKAAEAEADEAEAGGVAIRLRNLARAFRLHPLDVELLLIAIAPDLDPRFERLYGYLNDDVSRRRASVALALALCGVDLASGAGRARLGAAGPLVFGRLVDVEGPERPFLTRSLRVQDRVAGFLLGDDAPDPRLLPVLARTNAAGTVATRDVATREVATGDTASAAATAASPTPTTEINLARALSSGAGLAYLRERVGSDGRRLAISAVARLGAEAVVIDLATLPADPDLPAVAEAAGLEARLRRGAVVAGPIEALPERHAALIRQLADLPCHVVLHGTKPWDPAWSRKDPLLLDAQPAGAGTRSDAWRAALDGLPEAAATAAEVAAFPFRVAPPAIAKAAAMGRLAAAAEGRPVVAADLAAGVRAQNATGLEKLARRIEPRAGWAELVLPRDTVEQLEDLANRARYRDQVLDGWGLGNPNRGRGLTGLFTGDSGTGKTLSAEVVAGTLGLDLYVIDLSSVVDKYIGETEKNLDRVFSQADGVNGVLLFDEADAIFGKRSEVRDARDRYANVEIAYLLQRMEQFDGMAILTTNLRANLDEAFLRRLDVLIDFPMPDEAGRRRLWSRHLPPSLPVAGDIDLDFLARSFRISGGSIRNIVSTAAYGAVSSGRAVGMTDLIRGTEREYRKLGHLSTEAEFGPYYQSLGVATEARS